jgi:hypothetical protein
LTGQSKNRLNRNRYRTGLDGASHLCRDPKSSPLAAAPDAASGFEAGPTPPIQGGFGTEVLRTRHTRQFLPGELLINGMEILRICRVSFSEWTAGKLN